MYVLDKKEEIEKRRNVAPPPHHRWVDGVRHDTIPQPSSQQSQVGKAHSGYIPFGSQGKVEDDSWNHTLLCHLISKQGICAPKLSS